MPPWSFAEVNCLVIKSHFLGNEGKGIVFDIFLIAGRKGGEGMHGTAGLQSMLLPSHQRCRWHLFCSCRGSYPLQFLIFLFHAADYDFK